MGPGLLAIPVSLVVLPTILFAFCTCYMNLRYRPDRRSMLFRWVNSGARRGNRNRRHEENDPEANTSIFLWFRRRPIADDRREGEENLTSHHGDRMAHSRSGIHSIDKVAYSQVKTGRSSCCKSEEVKEEEADAESAHEKEACAICLVDMSGEDEVKPLPCGHVFHASCIDVWGRKSNVCPLCKAIIE